MHGDPINHTDAPLCTLCRQPHRRRSNTPNLGAEGGPPLSPSAAAQRTPPPPPPPRPIAVASPSPEILNSGGSSGSVARSPGSQVYTADHCLGSSPVAPSLQSRAATVQIEINVPVWLTEQRSGVCTRKVIAMEIAETEANCQTALTVT